MELFRRKTSKWATFRPFPLKEATDCLLNPYRGFYTICRMHADSLLLEEKNMPVTAYQPPQGHTLVLLEINLQHFREGDLSPEALEHVGAAFAHFSRIGMSMIVRFTYDWDGQGALNEPASLQIILRHMGQLSPLLVFYGPQIYILQGLFIGSWGEMHNTRYSSASHLIMLMEQLAACSSPHTYIAVRCPSQWRTIFRCYSPLSFSDMKRNDIRTRVGLFNDAIMGSETDLGTYGSLSRKVSTAYSDKLNRYDEILFQAQLCRFVPNGGEVLHASALNDFKPAMRTMTAMRISYLNSNYDRSVLDKWEKSPAGLGSFKKLSGLQYIDAHLGYRYALQKREIVCSQQCVSIRLSIANTGFSPCYRPVDVHLLLCDEQGGVAAEHRLETDVRGWMPDSSVQLSCEMAWPENGEKHLYLGIRLTERLTGKQIRLCNTPPLPFLMNPIGEFLL